MTSVAAGKSIGDSEPSVAAIPNHRAPTTVTTIGVTIGQPDPAPGPPRGRDCCSTDT
jgi:hypothetical protein